MDAAKLNLLVIRTTNMDTAAQFYKAVGLQFKEHQHGSGPPHLAAEHDGVVFEIYPARKGKETTGTRFGFRVADVKGVVARLELLGAEVRQHPEDGPWGRRAVVRDFDGHNVELTS